MMRILTQRFMRDLNVEVTLGLEKAAQILRSFVEQVVIQAPFLIDRHQPLEFASADWLPRR